MTIAAQQGDLTYIDKSKWPRGPWDNEPDKTYFEAHGYQCLALRHDSFGSFCGYVALPASHPWAGKFDSDDVACEVYGGLTYGPNACNARICHVPKPGESDDVRWIGFDCNHGPDFAPGMVDGNPYAQRRLQRYQRGEEIYRDLAFVKEQCARLALQARAVAAQETRR